MSNDDQPPTLAQIITRYLLEEVPDIRGVGCESLLEYGIDSFTVDSIEKGLIYVGLLREGVYHMEYREYPRINIHLGDPNSLPLIAAHVATCIRRAPSVRLG